VQGSVQKARKGCARLQPHKGRASVQGWEVAREGCARPGELCEGCARGVQVCKVGNRHMMSVQGQEELCKGVSKGVQGQEEPCERACKGHASVGGGELEHEGRARPRRAVQVGV